MSRKTNNLRKQLRRERQKQKGIINWITLLNTNIEVTVEMPDGDSYSFPEAVLQKYEPAFLPTAKTKLLFRVYGRAALEGLYQ